MKDVRTIVMSMLTFMIMLAWPEIAVSQWGSVSGNGNVVTQDRNVPAFTGIEVSCSADVYIKQGGSQAVKVKADENLLNLIKTDVSGGVLEIDIDGNIRNAKIMEVYVTVVNLDKVRINGSGDVKSEGIIKGMSCEIDINGSGDVNLELDVKSLESSINGSGDVDVSGVSGAFKLRVAGSGDFTAEQLRLTNGNINVQGSGDIKLSGSADKIIIDHSASGDVNLYSLNAVDVDARTNGSGDVVVNVSGILKVRLSGSGDLTYTGQPKSVDVSSSGSGEVYHRKN